VHRPRRRGQLIRTLAAGIFLANLAGCSSCVKDEQHPPAAQGPDLKVHPNVRLAADKRNTGSFAESRDEARDAAGQSVPPPDASAH